MSQVNRTYESKGHSEVMAVLGGSIQGDGEIAFHIAQTYETYLIRHDEHKLFFRFKIIDLDYL